MEKANLVHHGTNLMLDRVLKDLQVSRTDVKVLATLGFHFFLVCTCNLPHVATMLRPFRTLLLDR